MFKIFFNQSKDSCDDIIEKLAIEGIYNTYYEEPFEVITETYGYGYNLKDGDVTINIICENENEFKIIKNILDSKFNYLNYSTEELQNTNFQIEFEPVDLGNGYVLCSPDYKTDKNKINFIPQGAFGTGIHETTQDLLRYILNMDLTNKKVIDIGTGSGILSLAASIKNASKVVALDIRDVKDEIELNASLNNINNIEVVVGNAIEENLNLGNDYDLVIINIGGEETKMFMPLINELVKPHGTLLVSGLVEWSYTEILNLLENNNFKFISKKQGNEWISLNLKKTI